MDRALLERMIGAVVLVALIVLVAPALLDGTEVQGTARGGDNAPAAVRTEVIVLNPPVTEIRPGAGPAAVAKARSESAAVRSPSKPSAQPPENASESQKQAASVPAVQVGTKSLPRGFAVQLGSFAEQANAQRYARELSAAGYEVFVVRADPGSGLVFRVYAGPEKSRASADALSAKLRAKGHSVMVVDLGAGRG